MEYKRLGDVLIDAGLINAEQLDTALNRQKGTNLRLGEVLIQDNVITETELIEALQMQLGIEFIDLSQYVIPPEMSHVVSKNVARTYDVVPVKATADELYLAMSDPLNFVAVEEIKAASRKRVVPMVATSDAVQRAIMTLYGNE
ncbi:MAG: type II secretion system protein GspE, partial [Raoultibacter sp.]